VLNALLNLLLVHGVGWGIKGSAIGTVITSSGWRSGHRHRAAGRTAGGRAAASTPGRLPLVGRAGVRC